MGTLREAGEDGRRDTKVVQSRNVTDRQSVGAGQRLELSNRRSTKKKKRKQNKTDEKKEKTTHKDKKATK